VTCRDLLERIEPIAAGDQVLDDAMRTHLETCPGCSAALAAARRLDEYLAVRPVDVPPARFTATVLHRIRRERWRTEERVDRLFNVAMIFAAAVVVTGAAFLFNMSTAIEVAATASRVLSTAGEELLRRAAPSVGTYVAAMALLASALGMWWWADGGVTSRH
jgi:anti-sigma factor RsiW